MGVVASYVPAKGSVYTIGKAGVCRALQADAGQAGAVVTTDSPLESFTDSTGAAPCRQCGLCHNIDSSSGHSFRASSSRLWPCYSHFKSPVDPLSLRADLADPSFDCSLESNAWDFLLTTGAQHELVDAKGMAVLDIATANPGNVDKGRVAAVTAVLLEHGARHSIMYAAGNGMIDT